MALVKAKPVADSRPITYDNPVAAKIQQRRYQILVHSLLYYELDTTIVPDDQWAKWATELVSLQKEHPDIAERVIFAEAFKDFDGSTGFHLPFRDEQIVNIAHRLLRYHGNQDALSRLEYVARTPSEWETYKKQSHVVKPVKEKKEVIKVEQKPRKGLFSLTRA